MKSLNLDARKVERSLADWMTDQPGILKAFTRTELMDPNSTDTSPLFDKDAQIVPPRSERRCDGGLCAVSLVLAAAALQRPNEDRSLSHQPRHAARIRHPCAAARDGAAIEPGTRDDRVAPLAMAAILAECLLIPPPNGAEFPVPANLFKK